MAKEKPTIEELKRNHDSAQAKRREIEAERGQIDDQLQLATTSGNVEEAARLRQRKAELPALYGQASQAENAAREAWQGAERDFRTKAKADAEADLKGIRDEIARKTAEHQALMEKLASDEQGAINRLAQKNARLAEHQVAVEKSERGFKTALAAL